MSAPESTGRAAEAVPCAAGREGRARAVIDAVRPEVDGGRFPIKRTVGETVEVEADVVVDGHDVLTCLLRHRHESEPDWHEARMEAHPNDLWSASFAVDRLGRHLYTVIAWVDPFESWRRELSKRIEEADIAIALAAGVELIEAARGRAGGEDAEKLGHCAKALAGAGAVEERRRLALAEELSELMRRYAERRFLTAWPGELEVIVDRERARFSTWYELFPRSCAPEPGRHGTFADLEARLPYVAEMGFDVLYLPPVHPIGRTQRKGKNNALVAGPDDPGSPWAIGAAQGGHKAVHPELGTEQDLARLIGTARRLGLEIALDIAFQCSPDHPYVEAHPEWFRKRADGSIQFAENPPKKYEDIYPIHFESEAWSPLWDELRDVVLHWTRRGVRVFRVDNPHTKPFAFWEWLIAEVKRDYPDVLFLAEAFARPKIMHRLAKLGFTQSYTYFAWRNTKWELTEYLTELTRPGSVVREYFRPNFWPNTPDILTEHLQFGGRPAFMSRLVLAATLAASYGIYGPAFELCESEPREPGSEEYLDSEKYQLRHWDLERPDSLREFIARVNRIRREHPALQSDWSLRFHATDNEDLICYSKRSDDLSDIIVVVVNLDPHHPQSGWIELPVEALGIDAQRPYQAHDLLGGARFLWHGPRNFVEVDPQRAAHILRLRRRVRTERDFDYFL